MVGNDIKYDYLSDIIYYGESETVSFLEPFPLEYKDENGNTQAIYVEGKEKTVDFSGECAFSVPWSPKNGKNEKNVSG